LRFELNLQVGAPGRQRKARGWHGSIHRSKAMIRCVRLWTESDNNSHFEDGVIALARGAGGDVLTDKLPVTNVSFQETASSGSFAWHDAPVRQLVITLSGTLDFETRAGAHFILRPGDILLAEDTCGGGHKWKLVDQEPWRRVYVVLAPGAAVPFQPKA
jgi:quercetin dioxygenase-like cupin family protein